MKYLLVITLLSSCYTARRAKTQFAKATVAYPSIAAEYCAVIYPVKERVIQGRDSLRIDTLFGLETIIDTLRSLDTVYITKYIQGNTIRETVIRIDTVYQENTAALSAARLQLTAAIQLATDKTTESNKWRGKSKRHFNWFMICVGMLGLGIFLRIKRIL